MKLLQMMLIALTTVIMAWGDAVAQVPNWAWANDTNIVVGGMATDASGNVYSSSGLDSRFLVKMNNEGNRIWETAAVGSFDSPPAIQTYSNSVALDGSGNVFVTGLFTSDVLTLGGNDFSRVSTVDMFVAKFDPNGNFIWGNTLPIENVGNVGYNLATDGQGNVVVVGSYTAANLTVGSDSYTNPCTTGGGCPSMLVIKYDSNGGVLWSKSSFAGIGTTYCYSVVTDESDNIYVGGDFLANRTGVVKYDMNGNEVWNQVDGGWYVALDSFGDLLAGYDKNLDDAVLKRLDRNSGNILWTTTATGNASNKGKYIAVDQAGNTYFAGTYRNTSITFGSFTLNHSGGSDDDIFIVKYDDNGQVVWATSLNGDSWDALAGFTVDPVGNVFVNGYFLSSSLSFDAITIDVNVGLGYNLFFAKLGESSMSGTIPADPTSLDVNTVSASEISMSWADNSSDEDGFKIERSMDGVNFSPLVTLGANATMYDDMGLTPSTMYYYRAYAFNSDGNSGYTNVGFATTNDSTIVTPTFTDQLIGAGVGFSLSLCADGTVKAWGQNGNGSLGNGNTSNSFSQVTVSGLTDVIAIATESNHSLALKSDGTVWAWGFNQQGQIGDGTTANSGCYCTASPVQVTGLTNVVSIATGNQHSLALKDDGTVWAWGGNDYAGQLGNGSGTNSSVPVQVLGLSNVTEITAGDFHSLAIKSDGTVWTWGSNSNGQLGIAGGNLNMATQIPGLTNIVDIGAGQSHSVVLKDDGTVWSFGFNYFGQLGQGTPGDFGTYPTPMQVAGLDNISMIACGFNHSFAVKNDGTLWAWGANYNGQIGDGTSTQRDTPVLISGISNIVEITGKNHTLARTSTGGFYQWGSNDYGELGDGLTAYRYTPGQSTGLCNFPGSTVTVPVAPGGLVASATSQTTATLNWMDNSSDEDGFVISRGIDGVNFVNIATVNADVTTYNDIDLSCNTFYYYQVMAQNSAGTSTASVDTTTTFACVTVTIPTAPSGLVATATSQTTAMLNWMDNSNDEDMFIISRSLDGSSYTLIATVNANVSSYDDIDLACNTFYYYRVMAQNSAGTSTGSVDTTTTFACTTVTIPAAPSGLVANATSQTTAVLNWTDNSNDEDMFIISRSLDGSSYTLVATVNANVSSYDDIDLTCNTFYYYRVMAQNSAGTSTGTIDTTTTFACSTGTVPSTPTALDAIAVSTSQINLTWIDNSDNETGFKIKRSTDNITFITFDTVPANTTSYSDVGLSASTTYYYKVQAYNASGNSFQSNMASATTFGTSNKPVKPTNLVATTLTSYRIRLTWNDNSTNEAGFLIKRSIDNVNFYSIDSVPANTTSYISIGLNPETTYYYRVRAYNSFGNSPNSNIDSATTLANIAGIADLDENLFKVYPNPASTELTIELNDHYVAGAEIYSASGELVKTYLLNSPKTNLEISTFERGVYFLKVWVDDRINVVKVVKQ